MKSPILLALTICLILSCQARADEQDEPSMLTVYKTVTVSNHPGFSVKEVAPSSGIPNKSLSGERKASQSNSPVRSVDSNQKAVELENALPKTADLPVKVRGLEEKSKKPMKKAPQTLSQNDGLSDASEKTTLVDASFNSSAVKLSSPDHVNADAADFTFRPITLAPENTKANGPKATAPLLSKPPVRLNDVKTDKHVSSAIVLVASTLFTKLSIVSVLLFAIVQ